MSNFEIIVQFGEIKLKLREMKSQLFLDFCPHLAILHFMSILKEECQSKSASWETSTNALFSVQSKQQRLTGITLSGMLMQHLL